MHLFDPFSLSAIRLANRAVVPMPDGAALDDVLCAGLLLTRPLSMDAAGDLASPAQARAWRALIAPVHRGGGRIVARLSHGAETTGADARHIAQWVDLFSTASALALGAGFDGVEVDAADGALIDRFLHSADRRTDAYGGSPGERVRLLLEVVEAVADVWGVGRVGVRLSPHALPDTFTHAAAALDQLGLAWLHLVEPWRRPVLLADLRRHFGGAVIASGDYTLQTAQDALSAGLADCVAFERGLLEDWPNGLRLSKDVKENGRAVAS